MTAEDRPAVVPVSPPAPPAPAADPRSEVDRLAAQLYAAQLRAAGVTDTATLRVEAPHESITYGGITIGREPATVPASRVPALETAAANAGVTLIREA